MRACFLGQNICALGFGVATLQTPRLLLDEQTGRPLTANDEHVTLAGDKRTTASASRRLSASAPCSKSATLP
jgi:hypothetical protein